MKINVNAGHSYARPGASGLLNEVKEARKVRDALIAELKARGHTVTDSTASESASNTVNDQVKKANKSGAEIAVSIHLNAGGGTGSEVFYDARSSKGKALAQKVAPKLAASMGIRNRGAKADTAAAVGSLGWCRNTTMPAILLEICFVDSKTDYNAYKKTGVASIAYAIANALVGASSGSNSGAGSSGGTSTAKGYTVTVEADVLNIRAGAGTGYKVVGSVKRGEVYTIVDEKDGTGADKWGKLKSGAGWISLDYTDAKTEQAPKVPYVARVTASVLNVRAGAGTSYKVNEQVKKGDAFTIVEVKNGWGKLKSGAGWVSLEYMEAV